MRPIRERLQKLQSEFEPSPLFRAAYVMAQMALGLALLGLAGVAVKILMLKL